jgi:hypothetical protein
VLVELVFSTSGPHELALHAMNRQAATDSGPRWPVGKRPKVGRVFTSEDGKKKR